TTSNQDSLFGSIGGIKAKLSLENQKEETKQEKLLWEKELLGLYISGHPLDRIREKLEKRDINIKKIKEELGNGMPVTIAGIIESVRQVVTKNNERMAFLRIADLTDSIEAVVFPKLFTTSADVFIPEKCIALSGKVSLRNGEKSLIIEAAKEI
ncbi:MAG: OB-fold nucleic acid binding domain-containing protein, partial [Minisyncoccia bacterium]